MHPAKVIQVTVTIASKHLSTPRLHSGIFCFESWPIMAPRKLTSAIGTGDSCSVGSVKPRVHEHGYPGFASAASLHVHSCHQQVVSVGGGQSKSCKPRDRVLSAGIVQTACSPTRSCCRSTSLSLSLSSLARSRHTLSSFLFLEFYVNVLV
ncbi:unnamed protein product [Symbiodinium sp. CCMP2456]|nr:unnamed protein product [Symbiodinium sp. CCMP2456]